MDENAGLGGSYIIDPKTGERVLVERTKETADQKAAPKPAKPEKIIDEE